MPVATLRTITQNAARTSRKGRAGSPLHAASEHAKCPPEPRLQVLELDSEVRRRNNVGEIDRHSNVASWA